MVDLSGCAHDRWVRLDKARRGRNGDARHSSGRVIGMDRTEVHDARLVSGAYMKLLRCQTTALSLSLDT